MSKTLPTPSSFFPLQLDFIQAGTMRVDWNGRIHTKTIPHTIVCQALEGAYEVRCQNRHEWLSSGEVFVVPANTTVEITHWNGRRGMMAARWIHFRFSYIGLFDFLSFYETPLRVPRAKGREMGSLIGQLLKHSEPDRFNPKNLLVSQAIASRLLGLICTVSRPKKGEFGIGMIGLRLYPVLSTIRENLEGRLTVASLARVAGLSPAQFHAVFKRELRISPMQYVRRLRLESASRRLVATDEPVSEVAKATGFTDPFHFSHVFTAHFGVSPRYYRRQAAAGTV